MPTVCRVQMKIYCAPHAHESSDNTIPRTMHGKCTPQIRTWHLSVFYTLSTPTLPRVTLAGGFGGNKAPTFNIPESSNNQYSAGR
jgi:hypothetical protein